MLQDDRSHANRSRGGWAAMMVALAIGCATNKAVETRISGETVAGAGGTSSSGGGATGGNATTAGSGMTGGGTSETGSGGATTAGTSGTGPMGAGGSPGPVAFPLKLSANKRYLVDQNNAPFLINQASSWGLIQALSNADAKDYLDALQHRGFNTVMVSIISGDLRFAGGPPNWQGVPPFKVQWDFSTFNDAYFQHADDVINMAKARGMLVTLVPAYLGYAGDNNQGWHDELLSANNSIDKSAAYGRFLGNRYKDATNIVWVAGGDNLPAPGSELETRLKAIIDGIKQNDSAHLWTAHWGGSNSVWSLDNPSFTSYIDINGYYAYDHDATQVLDLKWYNQAPVHMTLHLDQSYETEPGGTPENIRRKAYEAVLSGVAGSSFCAGPNWYLFANWRANMDTTGTRETELWYGFFKSRPWQDLVPDQTHSVVTGGLGTEGSNDWVAAARTSSRGTAIAYLPSSRSVTVNLASISGTQANVWWYDPTKGASTSGGAFPTTGSKSLTPPSSGSWVLVIDDASLGLQAPAVSPVTASPAPVPFPRITGVLAVGTLLLLLLLAGKRGMARRQIVVA